MNRVAASGVAISLLAGALLGAAPAAAATLSYSTGLTSPAITLDFSGLGEGTAVGNTYAAQGVTFGGLYVNSFFGNTLSPTTAPAAVNFLGGTTNVTFTIGFDAPISDAAFFLFTDGSGTTITSSLAGVTLETVTATTYSSSGNDFFGFTGSSFDLITVTVSGSGNAVIDNLELGQSAAVVPEPGTAAIVMVGLTGLLAFGRRRV